MYNAIRLIAWLVVLSFLITIFLVPVFIRTAYYFKILDIPDGKIKKHKQPTPYLGGVAVYSGCMASIGLFFPVFPLFMPFFIGVTFLLCLGFFDDIIVLKPWQKFIGQIGATFFLLAPFFSMVNVSLLSSMVAFIWCLGIINAFNLIDVMDGLATIVAFFSCMAFVIVAFFFNSYGVIVIMSSLLGSLGAFFIYNFPPAAVYLGDAGSLFLGGVFAGVSVLLPWHSVAWYSYFIPVILLAIPLLEVATLISFRLYKGIPFYLASPDHFSMYLQCNGLSKRHILLYMSILSFFLLLLGCLLLVSYLTFPSVFLSMCMVVVFWFLIMFTYRSQKL